MCSKHERRKIIAHFERGKRKEIKINHFKTSEEMLLTTHSIANLFVKIPLAMVKICCLNSLLLLFKLSQRYFSFVVKFFIYPSYESVKKPKVSLNICRKFISHFYILNFKLFLYRCFLMSWNLFILRHSNHHNP